MKRRWNTMSKLDVPPIYCNRCSRRLRGRYKILIAMSEMTGIEHGREFPDNHWSHALLAGETYLCERCHPRS